MQLIINDRLLRHLEERFPDKLPRSAGDIEDIRLLQGEQRVIDYLKSLKETIEEEGLA
jgi:hypothetical protein